jgi:hypothetical protein
MSSLIVAEQPITSGSAGSDNNSDTLAENKLTGLGPLMATNKLCIKQRIRACEILSLVTGCEVKLKIFWSSFFIFLQCFQFRLRKNSTFSVLRARFYIQQRNNQIAFVVYAVEISER